MSQTDSLSQARHGRTSTFNFMSLVFLLIASFVLLVYRTSGTPPQNLLLVVSPNLPHKYVQTFDAASGQYLGIFGNVSDPFTIAVGPDNYVYVVDNISPSTLTRFTKQGLFVDAVTMEGTGDAMAFGPDGVLYYTDYGSAFVARLNVTTFPPTPLGFFIPPRSTLQSAQGLAITSDGQVFIADTEAGRIVATHISNTDGLNATTFTSAVARPHALTISEAKGLVLVADGAEMRSFHIQSGEPLGTFATMPGDRPLLTSLGFSPNDGDLYLSTASPANLIQRYNGTTGAFMQNFISSRLSKPSGFAFLSRDTAVTTEASAMRVSGPCVDREAKPAFHGSQPGFDITLSMCRSSSFSSLRDRIITETERTSVEFQPSFVSVASGAVTDWPTHWIKRKANHTESLPNTLQLSQQQHTLSFSSSLLQNLSVSLNTYYTLPAISSSTAHQSLHTLLSSSSPSLTSSLVGISLRINGSEQSVHRLFNRTPQQPQHNDFLEWSMNILNTQAAGTFTGKYETVSTSTSTVYTFYRTGHSAASSCHSISSSSFLSSLFARCPSPSPSLRVEIPNDGMGDNQQPVAVHHRIATQWDGSAFVVVVTLRIPSFVTQFEFSNSSISLVSSATTPSTTGTAFSTSKSFTVDDVNELRHQLTHLLLVAVIPAISTIFGVLLWAFAAVLIVSLLAHRSSSNNSAHSSIDRHKLHVE